VKSVARQFDLNAVAETKEQREEEPHQADFFHVRLGLQKFAQDSYPWIYSRREDY
jgi:hypothetical protein